MKFLQHKAKCDEIILIGYLRQVHTEASLKEIPWNLRLPFSKYRKCDFGNPDTGTRRFNNIFLYYNTVTV